ncbi:MAG: prepilin-type N-terminal cleavage/methylation domain-containing protein [Planctomycetes bacterium]|nr:prepilin-type N-terminal cleavage/methylation domain-containing protein [Planctomycetota bacterium]
MRRGSAGLTLLEVVIALAVFSIAALGLASVIFSTSRLNEGNRERTVVENAARSMIEKMRNEEFAEIFRLYNSDPADDPLGPGTGPGANFAVTGLQAIEGDPDGLPGRIEFPTVVNELREDFDLPELQMPRDLSGDGLVDGNNHAADYRILPVTVVVEWRSIGGTTRTTYRTVFVPK